MTRKISIAAILSAFLCLFSTLGWAGAAPIYYAHNDHLGTPQKLTDQSGKVVWQADYDPFGVAVVDDDPDSDGNAIEFNLRFPGQYYDKYTGKNYNYFRDYDPSTGRYLQSDPIGIMRSAVDPMIDMFHSSGSSSVLNAHSLNHVYNYAIQNPLSFFDLYGLDIYRVCRDQATLIRKTCRACIKVVCNLPAVSKLCCKLDFDGCIADSNGDPQKMSECAAKEIACALKRENKMPKKEPKDGEI